MGNVKVEPKVEPNNLKAEMARYGVRLETLASEIGIGITSASHKMNGKKTWTLVEAKKIRDYFNGLAGEQKHTIDSLFG
jgi:antitoxin component HigA of HigAB toxin-antitoxin module